MCSQGGGGSNTLTSSFPLRGLEATSQTCKDKLIAELSSSTCVRTQKQRRQKPSHKQH